MKNYVKEYKGHKVPDGATHYHMGNTSYFESFYYCDDSGTVMFFVVDKLNKSTSWNRSNLNMPPMSVELPLATEIDWDGKGLPPIGCECDVSFSNQAFESGVVLFMGSEMAIINLNSAGYSEQHCHLNSTEFRPLKTAEEKEREAFHLAVVNACMGIHKDDFNINEIAGVLFHAGFKAPKAEK